MYPANTASNKFTRFIFATESYGGHYGPSFVTFFDQQNALIDAGKLEGEKIEVSALMINKWVFFPSPFPLSSDFTLPQT